ncbi:MAG: hypothetical protein LBH65_01910 [Desulfovibrio sp.]|jgi:hypothetical protein|nr:hypothetical protein [Desulfovibrio sp.]
MDKDAMPSSADALSALLSWLRERHAEIMGHEKAALAALEKNDTDGYRRFMVDKAVRIAALGEDAAAPLAALPDDIREAASSALRRFSGGAQNALRLDSSFYMSALLYPDDHKKGEPDNLQRLIAELEKN